MEGGVRLRGRRAEVYAHGQYAGQLVRWHLRGDDRDWEASAERYILDAFLMDSQDVRVRFLLETGGRGMTLWADGTIQSPFTADDRFHGEQIELKGGKLWLTRGAAPSI